MKLHPMQGYDRHKYYKCSNPKDDIYTLVQASLTVEQDTWLNTQFKYIQGPSYASRTLPAYRLYKIVEDRQ